MVARPGPDTMRPTEKGLTQPSVAMISLYSSISISSAGEKSMFQPSQGKARVLAFAAGGQEALAKSSADGGHRGGRVLGGVVQHDVPVRADGQQIVAHGGEVVDELDLRSVGQFRRRWGGAARKP
ncbi:hypothetical protein PF005_g12054 [Phytophthora fragariae]|uniref:Uncharacterized protein n=1 Tax=Phytophthora fragariae TaxID=53985 RepID=A0A6A3XV46_9STRA|nr:hypothetical protein PF003_g7075 [Phytophthora fragariae]KAE8937198.1 hypothetical protein PF009_g12897 [Phytophthora fragariae]KAE9008318.1 hypothetical protein PF011_g10757 [Phytophthora fragariae]KAE9109322.1 hypothetical protein PF010_g11585 [Phytophthora fragariae]KAE9144077.1 hypothetical protein PF006_g10946 [Phytophthora fragariae]